MRVPHGKDSKDILIVENDPEVPPGILVTLLEREHQPYRIARPHRGEPLSDASSLGAVMVLGGAMGTSECDRFPHLKGVKRFMETAVSACVPLLGICLGAQLLAEVLGGEVLQHTHGERGLHEVTVTEVGRSDPLFSMLPETFFVFQWHNDSFIPPADALLLATSALCPHQAFRYGSHTYGIQFHPEVDESIVRAWSADEPARARLRQSYRAHCLAGQNRVAARLLESFIGLVETRA